MSSEYIDFNFNTTNGELEVEAYYYSDTYSDEYCDHSVFIYLSKEQTRAIYEKLKEHFGD